MDSYERFLKEKKEKEEFVEEKPIKEPFWKKAVRFVLPEAVEKKVFSEKPEVEVPKKPSTYERFLAEKEKIEEIPKYISVPTPAGYKSVPIKSLADIIKPELKVVTPLQKVMKKGIVWEEVSLDITPKPLATWEILDQLPPAILDTLKRSFPAFDPEKWGEAFRTVNDPVWTSLPFTQQLKHLWGAEAEEIIRVAKTIPQDAIQFMATPIIGAVEEIFDISLGEIKLPTKIGEWIGPLTGTRTQTEQYKRAGLTETEAKALVITQQMGRALPFVTFFGMPAYIEALIRRPTIEQVVEVSFNKAISGQANKISKTAKLPDPLKDPSFGVRSSTGTLQQIVRIKGHPNKYLVISSDTFAGLKSVSGFELTDPLLQLQSSAFTKAMGFPEIPLPTGVKFLKVNPALPGLNTWITLAPGKTHVYMLEESLKRVLPTIITKKPTPLPAVPPPLPIPKVVPEVKPEVEPIPVKPEVELSTKSQKARIHILAKEKELTGDKYVSFLKTQTGKTSTKELTKVEASKVIGALTKLPTPEKIAPEAIKLPPKEIEEERRVEPPKVEIQKMLIPELLEIHSTTLENLETTWRLWGKPCLERFTELTGQSEKFEELTFDKMNMATIIDKERIINILREGIKEVKPEVKAIPEELEPLAKEARKYESAVEFVEKGLESHLYYPIDKNLFELQTREESNIEVIKRALEKKGTPEQIKNRKEMLRKSEEVVETVKTLRVSGFDTYTDFYNQAVEEVKPEVEKVEELKMLKEALAKEKKGVTISKREYEAIEERIREIEVGTAIGIAHLYKGYKGKTEMYVAYKTEEELAVFAEREEKARIERERFVKLKKEAVRVERERGLAKLKAEIKREVKPEVPKEMTTAEMRDRLDILERKLDTTEGKERERVVDEGNEIRDKLNEFYDKNVEKVLSVMDDVHKDREIANIEVVKYSDGKYGVSSDVSTAISGRSGPINGAFDTKQQAIDSERKSIEQYVKSNIERGDTSKREMAQFNKILQALVAKKLELKLKPAVKREVEPVEIPSETFKKWREEVKKEKAEMVKISELSPKDQKIFRKFGITEDMTREVYEQVSMRLLPATAVEKKEMAVDMEVERLKADQEMRLEASKINPASELHKYANKRTGKLPEVTGVGESIFARKGDDIVDELGYPDTETARSAYDEWLRTDKKRYTDEELRRQAKGNIGMVGEKEAKYTAKAEQMEGIPSMVRESKIRIHLQKKGYIMARQEKVESPEDVAVMFKELKNESREKFFVVNLDKENKIINIDNVSIGSTNANLVHPMEAFKSSVLSGAKSNYFVHNHPSGDIEPSEDDITIQVRIKKLGEILGIENKGHIIMDRVKFGFLKKDGSFESIDFVERKDGKVKVKVVEPRQFIRKNPRLYGKAISSASDVASASRAILDRKTDTVVVFYLDARNVISGVDIKGFSFRVSVKELTSDIVRGAILHNALSAIVSTNIDVFKYVDFFNKVDRFLKRLAGFSLTDVIQTKGEKTISLKAKNLIGEKVAKYRPMIREKPADYWETTRPPTKVEKEIMDDIKKGDPVVPEHQDILYDMIVKGWVIEHPKLKVIWNSGMIKQPKAIRKRAALSPEMRERIKRVEETTEERGINRHILSQLRNGFIGKKRTRLEDLSQEQLDELHKTLLELTPDKFGKFKLVDKETLEVMSDFIPPSLLKRRAVTTGDVFQHLDPKDIRYILSLARAPRDVLKGTPTLDKIYHMVSTAEEDARIDSRDFNKKLTELYKAAKKENKNVDENVVRYIEQDVKAPGPQTKELAEFLKKWWKDSLPVMKPRRIRTKYFTHTPETFSEKAKREGLAQALREVLMPIRKEAGIAPDIIANLEYILGAEKFNPFALPRSEYRAYSKRIYKAVGAYARVYYFKKHFDPIMPDVFRMRQFLPGNKQLYLRKWLQNIRGRPLDYKWGRKAHRISDTAVRYEYVRLLALNLGSGMVNAIGGTLNNISEMPVTKFALGHKRLITKQGRMILDKYGFTGQSFWLDPAGGMWEKLTKVERSLYIFMKMGEFYLRGIPALALIPEDEFKTGELSFKTRVEIRRLIGKTQGLYGVAQSPLLSQTVAGRPLYQFKNWMILELELFLDWSKEALDYIKRNPTSGMNPVKNPGLAKWIKFLLLAIPLYIWGAEKIKKQVEAYWFLPLAIWRTITHPDEVPVLKDLELVIESLYDIAKGDEESATERFRKEWLTHLPAGVELKRGANFFRALKEGGYYSSTGKLVRKMPPKEAFVQLIVGQMSKEAVEYRKMNEELSKLMPYTYIEYNEFFGQRVRKSDYIKMKEKIMRRIEEKGYRNMTELKKDKELVQIIKDYNKQAEEKLRELMKERNEVLEKKFTLKEWKRNKKLVTIQSSDIERWMETEERGETIESFERRLGR